MGEIENAILELNRIGGVYDSVVTALRILEGQKKIYKIDDDIKFKDTLQQKSSQVANGYLTAFLLSIILLVT